MTPEPRLGFIHSHKDKLWFITDGWMYEVRNYMLDSMNVSIQNNLTPITWLGERMPSQYIPGRREITLDFSMKALDFTVGTFDGDLTQFYELEDVKYMSRCIQKILDRQGGMKNDAKKKAK